MFGGCRPNGNNFKTADECTLYCQAANTPSPLELIANPTDASGNEIPDPRGGPLCEENKRGELICKIPPTPTPYGDLEDEDDD